MNYKTTIGLEIHAELKTKTGLFCRCLNVGIHENPKPNSNVCPICMGHPGTLPTLNKEAVRSVLKVGVALESVLADFTQFDRKHYFYPDIPKGYQISQYKFPLVSGGSLNGVSITRIHLEEDTARSIHIEKDDSSLIDFNRAGVPLMELVTDPVINSAKQASDFAKELQLLLRTLNVADAEMSRGEMRVEANISVSKDENFGTKVEVKNLNSFKSVEKAIEYEVKRHIEALENGEKIVQETRGWDENKQKTFSQRQKEDSHDYRYFPDPDLPKLKLSLIKEFSKEVIKDSLPELPKEKRKKYKTTWNLKDEDINLFVENPLYGNFFELVAEKLKGKDKAIILASNYIASDVAGFVNVSEIQFPAWLTRDKENSSGSFAKLMNMLDENKLSSRAAKDILKIMFEKGGDPEVIAEEGNLLQKNNSGELEEMLKKIIDTNPAVVADYKAGKESALMFFVGQVMKESKGSANPSLAKEIALKLLK